MRTSVFVDRSQQADIDGGGIISKAGYKGGV